MAKATKKTSPPRTPRAKKPKTRDTRESLIAEMGVVLDRVDALLPDMKEVSWRWGGGPLGKLRDEVNAIANRMYELIGSDSNESVSDVFLPALSAPGGAVPSLAKPGMWVEWVGYIPILVFWAGFMGGDTSLNMADPAEKWINSSGYQSLHIYPSRGNADLRKMVREELATLLHHKKFDLHDVDEEGRKDSLERLAANEWLRKTIEAGPVDQILMPPRLRAVQTMPFA